MVKMKKTKQTTKTTKLGKFNWKKAAITFVSVCAVIATIGGGVFAWSIYKETEDFDVDRLNSNEASKIYNSATGELFFTFGDDENGKRTNVTYEELPQVLVDAIVAAEDSRFFEHNGFDLPRIAKAAITNLMSFSLSGGGGSTITQQVIKKSYFPNEEKTLTRKASEVFLAMQATKEVSKEEILTLYLNKIYFGRSINSIGIAAASKYYFNKDVSNLTLPEAALLAGTLNSPNRFDPYYDLEAGTTRRNTILKLMVDHGYITQEECDGAKAVKVENMLNKGASTNTMAYQPYVDLVAKEVKEKTGLDPKETQMNIYTYIDPELQKYLDSLINGGEYKFPDEFMQAGASIQTHDGRIIGVIGGRNYEATGTNRADVKQQPGSTLKPIIDYGAAFEFVDWSTAHEVEDKAYGKPGFNPNNWDGTPGKHGKMSIANALHQSWNTPAVWAFDSVVNKIGFDGVMDYLEGFKIDMSKEEIAMGYSIGGWQQGTTPIEMASMYSTIVNNGTAIEPHTIDRIEIIGEDKVIEVDKDCQKEASEAISPAAAFMIRAVQSEYIGMGGGTYNGLNFAQIRAKTGTSTYDSTNSYGFASGTAKDSWLAAYNPDYSLAVWMGYDQAGLKENPLHMNRHTLDAGKLASVIFKYLAADGVKNSYPKQPDDVFQASIVKGVFPYKSPSANTPADKIATGWFKKGTGPSGTVEELGINNLSSFEASLDSNKRINVKFAPYNPIEATTNADTNDATKMYGKVIYVVEVTDAASGAALYSTKLSTNSGTLDYVAKGKVNVTGYYSYENANGLKSNSISKILGEDAALSAIKYSVNNGALSQGGSIVEGTAVQVAVTPQSSDSVIEITLLNSTGAVVKGPIKASSTSFSDLVAGKYTIKITETKGNQSATPVLFTFIVTAATPPVEPTP